MQQAGLGEATTATATRTDIGRDPPLRHPSRQLESSTSSDTDEGVMARENGRLPLPEIIYDLGVTSQKFVRNETRFKGRAIIMIIAIWMEREEERRTTSLIVKTRWHRKEAKRLDSSPRRRRPQPRKQRRQRRQNLCCHRAWRSSWR